MVDQQILAKVCKVRILPICRNNLSEPPLKSVRTLVSPVALRISKLKFDRSTTFLLPCSTSKALQKSFNPF